MVKSPLQSIEIVSLNVLQMPAAAMTLSQYCLYRSTAPFATQISDYSSKGHLLLSADIQTANAG